MKLKLFQGYTANSFISLLTNGVQYSIYCFIDYVYCKFRCMHYESRMTVFISLFHLKRWCVCIQIEKHVIRLRYTDLLNIMEAKQNVCGRDVSLIDIIITANRIHRRIFRIVSKCDFLSEINLPP